MIEVLSSGGGTQSTAIIVLIIQGKIQKPDYIVIADTGREMPTTLSDGDDLFSDFKSCLSGEYFL